MHIEPVDFPAGMPPRDQIELTFRIRIVEDSLIMTYRFLCPRLGAVSDGTF